MPGPASAGPTPRAGPGRCPDASGREGAGGAPAQLPGGLPPRTSLFVISASPWRGRGRTVWQFWGPRVVRRLIWQKSLETGGRRLQANGRLPQPLPAGGTLPGGCRGDSLPCSAQPGGLPGPGQGRPWRPLCDPTARGGPQGFAEEASGLPAPRGAQLSRPWHALNPGPGASWWP